MNVAPHDFVKTKTSTRNVSTIEDANFTFDVNTSNVSRMKNYTITNKKAGEQDENYTITHKKKPANLLRRRLK